MGPYGQWPTPADGARPSESVASRHESRAGSARDRKGRRGRNGEQDNGEKRKQHFPAIVVNGILNAPVQDKSSGKSIQVTISEEKGHLSQDTVRTRRMHPVSFFRERPSRLIPFSTALVSFSRARLGTPALV